MRLGWSLHGHELVHSHYGSGCPVITGHVAMSTRRRSDKLQELAVQSGGLRSARREGNVRIRSTIWFGLLSGRDGIEVNPGRAFFGRVVLLVIRFHIGVEVQAQAAPA